MTETVEKKDYVFQTEISRLLHLLSHSLYQNREISLRELISNASDAVDKMRFLQLQNEQHRDEEELAIRLEIDKDNRVLTIADNGIGMTRDELVENLGTIAHSGSLSFLEKLSGDKERDLSLIGQFGVGFYSAFMLADKVEVLSRGYDDDQPCRWESDGTGSFSIEPIEETVPRGTQVRLHLKADLDEFLEPERLSSVIRRYSTFVPHPIYLGDDRLNTQRPIWLEPKSQVSDEQYNEFFQYLSHGFGGEPLWHMHIASDSPLQFHCILYTPSMNPEKLGLPKVDQGLHLCAKRILVQDRCRELLPEYLRFVVGLVDSADLPLNVSREALQDNAIFGKIRKVLVKRILDHLQSMADDQPEDYRKFFNEFGTVLREGIGDSFEHREKIARLMLFKSSANGLAGEPTSLDGYVGRVKDGQKQIFYYSAPESRSFESNPNLEIFRERGVEVLYLTDPVDEYLLLQVGQFRDFKLTSIDSADVDLPARQGESTESTESEEPAADKPAPGGFERVLLLFREALDDQVAEVRKSNRLTDSPCCLVNPDGSMSTQLQKVLQMAHGELPGSKKILEINPQAALIQRLCELSANNDHDAFIQDCGRQLLTHAQLSAGLSPDPAEVVKRMEGFLEDLAGQRSPIVT